MGQLTDGLNALIRYANETTGASDATISAAVETLINGYGQGGGGGTSSLGHGGTNPRLVGTFDRLWTMADTSFVPNSTAPTSATTIMANAKETLTLTDADFASKDIVIIERGFITPTYDGTESGVRQKAFAFAYAYYISRQKTTEDGVPSSVVNLATTKNLYDYYNSSGVATYIANSYGIYFYVAAPQFSSNRVSLRTPAIQCRCNNSYITADNMKKITSFNCNWRADVYVVDSLTNMQGLLEDDCDYMVNRHSYKSLPVYESGGGGYTFYDWLWKPVWNNGAYIDTGLLNEVGGWKFECKTKVMTSPGSANLMGDSANGWLHVLDFPSSSTCRWIAQANSNIQLTKSDWVGNLQTFVMDDTSLSVNGEAGSINADSGNTPIGNIILLQGRNGAGWDGYLYYFKIWRNGTLLRDYVPATNEAGDAGLYDRVNNQFYTNVGAGVMVCGKD